MRRESKRGKVSKILSVMIIISIVTTLFQPIQRVMASSVCYSGEIMNDIYETDSYDVYFNVESYWSGAYNASVTIVNKSDEDIQDWCIAFELNEKISTIWNATIAEESEGSYKIKNAGWNQDILSGESVSFGFIATGDFTAFPEYYKMLGVSTIVKDEEVQIEYNVLNDWGTGASLNIIITNNRSTLIEDWSLEFNCTEEISYIWNANIASSENGIYKIKNAGYNQNIEPGESVVIGMVTYSSENVINISDFELIEFITEENNVEENKELEIVINTEEMVFDEETSKYSVVEYFEALTGKIISGSKHVNRVLSGSAITVEEAAYLDVSETESGSCVLSGSAIVVGDTESSGVYETESENSVLSGSAITIESLYDFDISEITDMTFTVYNLCGDIVSEGDIVPAYEWRAENVGLVLGENVVVITVETNKKEYKKVITVINYSEDNMKATNIDMNDDDGDGISNYAEKIYKTDKNKADTDTDGISDYVELIDIGTNPLLADTDHNGITDALEDTDGDGISNITEHNMGTKSYALDTDRDGVSDYDEIEVYCTDPLAGDTDADGATDIWEIRHGYSPVNYDETFILEEALHNIEGEVSLEIKLPVGGRQVDTFLVEEVHNNFYVNSTIPGYMYAAYDFSLSGDLEKADVKVYFDERYIEIEDLQPVLYYFNEDNGELEEIETFWDGKSNYVTSSLSHFSTYLLLNKTKYDAMVNIYEDRAETEEEKEEDIDIVIVLSAVWDIKGDLMVAAKKEAKKFINTLSENDRVALVAHTWQVKLLSGLTTDYDYVISEIDLLTTSSRSFDVMIKAMKEGVSLFESNDAKKIMLFISDARDIGRIDKEDYDYIIGETEKKDISIYTIEVGHLSDYYLSDKKFLIELANTTGGEYCNLSDVDKIQKIIDNLGKDVIDYTKDSNNDGITDYYTKLLCEGKILTKTGKRVMLESDYEKIQASDDYDCDGLKNGEEIIIKKEGENRIYAVEYSDMFQADTDGDSYRDGAERYLGIDPLKYNISEADYNYLTDNDMYMASVISTKYNNSDWLKFQLYAGNIIFNCKWNFAKDYRATLLEYISLYSESTLENKVCEFFIGFLENDKAELAEEIYSIISMCTSTAEKGVEGAEAYQSLLSIQQQIDNLSLRQSTLNNMGDVYNASAQWFEQLQQIQEDLDNNRDLYMQFTQDNDIEIAVGNFISRFANIQCSIPSGLKNFIQQYNAVDEKLEKVGIALDVGTAVYDVISVYSCLYSEISQYEEICNMLQSISIHSENEILADAAADIRSAINDDISIYLSMSEDIAIAIWDNMAVPLITDAVVSKIQKEIKRVFTKIDWVSWAVTTGLTVGDLVANTGAMNEIILGTIALGDASVAYVKSFNSIDETETEGFYYIDDYSLDSFRNEMSLCAQLRIVGEDSVVETCDTRGGFIKIIDDLVYDVSQEELKEDIIAKIDTIVTICSRLKADVNDNYDGMYVRN